MTSCVWIICMAPHTGQLPEKTRNEGRRPPLSQNGARVTQTAGGSRLWLRPCSAWLGPSLWAALCTGGVAGAGSPALSVPAEPPMASFLLEFSQAFCSFPAQSALAPSTSASCTRVHRGHYQAILGTQDGYPLFTGLLIAGESPLHPARMPPFLSSRLFSQWS